MECESCTKACMLEFVSAKDKNDWSTADDIALQWLVPMLCQQRDINQLQLVLFMMISVEKTKRNDIAMTMCASKDDIEFRMAFWRYGLSIEEWYIRVVRAAKCMLCDNMDDAVSILHDALQEVQADVLAVFAKLEKVAPKQELECVPRSKKPLKTVMEHLNAAIPVPDLETLLEYYMDGCLFLCDALEDIAFVADNRANEMVDGNEVWRLSHKIRHDIITPCMETFLTRGIGRIDYKTPTIFTLWFQLRLKLVTNIALSGEPKQAHYVLDETMIEFGWEQITNNAMFHYLLDLHIAKIVAAHVTVSKQYTDGSEPLGKALQWLKLYQKLCPTKNKSVFVQLKAKIQDGFDYMAEQRASVKRACEKVDDVGVNTKFS